MTRSRSTAPDAGTTRTVTLTYLVAAGLWILLSDLALRWLIRDPDVINRLQTVKGWAFVLVTSAVLFGVLQRRARRLRVSVAAAEARERLLDAIQRAVPIGIVVLDAGGRVLSLNPGAERLLEGTGAGVGRRLSGGGEDGRPSWFPSALAGERVADVPERLTRVDGTTCDLLVSAGPLPASDAQAAGVVAVLTDVTHGRLLEAQLRHAQKMSALGQVAGGIAHDFRNVLTVVTAFAEHMQGRLPPGDAELEADLRDLLEAASRGTAVTQRLLAFSRREPAAPRTVDLRHVAQDAVSVLRRVLPASIELEIESAPEAVPTMADPNAVVHMLTNLATNARDAMPDGGRLRVVVRGDHAPSAVPSAVLEVVDSGVGMDTATVARVFDPFFTTKPPGTGTGLGLPIVRSLAADQQGTVEVESTPGGGTTVRVRLPLAAAPKAEPFESPWPAPVRGGGETILVVEDEEAIRRTAKRALEQLGYTVMLAEDGDEALRMVRGGRSVDLIISDSVMPKLGGLDLYGRLLADGFPGRFLMVSGYDPRDDAPRPNGTAGSPPFLAKPWTLAELAHAVRQVLDHPARGLESGRDGVAFQHGVPGQGS